MKTIIGLNNKGYMLVEIIMASVLAMVVTYFIMDLTIKLKNKNDDLLVKTLVYTDQAIIYNTIMKDLNEQTAKIRDLATGENITCVYIDNMLKIDGNVFQYGEFKNVISEYAEVLPLVCNDNTSLGDDYFAAFTLTIPIRVKQLPDEKFDVVINYYRK